MDRLLAISRRLIEETPLTFRRYLYDEINWKNRLIIIKGARGVGKTTLLRQRLRREFADKPDKAIYISLDNVLMSNISLMDVAEYLYTRGGTHIFLDEVHKYKNWAQSVKSIYDSYPGISIVCTGSSMLKIGRQVTADLSRRHRMYTLDGLSFREYLELEGVAKLRPIPLQEILANHTTIAMNLAKEFKPLAYFNEYLRRGFYPFYQEEGDGYNERVLQSLSMMIENEIPLLANIEYESVYKIKQLLAILASRTPYTLNITNLCKDLGTSRNNLIKLIELMDQGSIIRRLFAGVETFKTLVKPEKILFNNASMMYALTTDCDAGTKRETFAAQQLAHNCKICMPQKGDLLADGKFLFEVGGRKKGYQQIKDIDSSYVLADDIEVGFDNKIPLWLLGMTY